MARVAKKPERTRSLVIDIRDQRLPGGRLTLSSRTTDPLEYAIRKAAVAALLDEGPDGMAVIERLRRRKVHIQTVAERLRARQLRELLAETEEPEPEEEAPPPLMLGAMVDRFLHRASADCAPGTVRNYTSLARIMEKAFGVERDPYGEIQRDVPIGPITSEHADAWLHGPQETNGGRTWSAKRRIGAHAVALQVWALALETDEENAERQGTPRTITRNIFAKGKATTRPPKARATRVVFLSRTQAGRLLRATRGGPDAVLYALGIYAGLRSGEARHLRVGKDVDLKRGLLHIQPRDGEHPWRPKSENSIRDTPIHPRLARWIRAHLRHGYAGDRYLLREPRADRPLTQRQLEVRTQRAYAAAGIPYGRTRGDSSVFHTLRHTFASWLCQRDVQLLKIAKLMGDTEAVVSATYAHLLPSDLARAVEHIGRKG